MFDRIFGDFSFEQFLHVYFFEQFLHVSFFEPFLHVLFQFPLFGTSVGVWYLCTYKLLTLYLSCT